MDSNLHPVLPTERASKPNRQKASDSKSPFNSYDEAAVADSNKALDKPKGKKGAGGHLFQFQKGIRKPANDELARTLHLEKIRSTSVCA